MLHKCLEMRLQGLVEVAEVEEVVEVGVEEVEDCTRFASRLLELHKCQMQQLQVVVVVVADCKKFAS